MSRDAIAFHKARMSKAQANGSRGDGGLSERTRMEDADQRFMRALALAFQRGDHLPKGAVKPLLLVG